MEQFKDSGVGLKEKLASGKEYYEIRLESIGGLGTEFLMIVLFFVGALAGFRNIYLLSLKMIRADEKTGNKKRISNERAVKKDK